MDITQTKYIHFSGIKGVGMTALALYAQDMGMVVTGSDTRERFVTAEVLEKRKIPITLGFNRNNLPHNSQVLVYSAAHPRNPQILDAFKRNLLVLSYAQALGYLTRNLQTIAVCGVGGKSTTTAMIATIMQFAHLNPSFIVGVGNIANLGTPGRYAKGKYVVVEADEYVAVPEIDPTPKFLYLTPKIIVVTNIEYDHPDVYSDLTHTKQAFFDFFSRLDKTGLLVANTDNSNIQQVLKRLRNSGRSPSIITYGYSPQAQWRLINVLQAKNKTQSSINVSGVKINYTLCLPGRFNALNACAALAVATYLGVSQKIAINALKTFSGTQRRFQLVGTYRSVEVWDDYAHHPTQIRATLEAARKCFANKRLVVIFQPHTYSRTKAMLEEFAKVLSLADEIILTDIYASARETAHLQVSSSLLAEKIRVLNKKTRALEDKFVLKYLKQTIHTGDVVMTLGAGDVYKIAESLVNRK